MLNELSHLGELILSEDAICQGHPDPKPYSDAEIRRFNEALVRYDLMTARVLFIGNANRGYAFTYKGLPVQER